MTKKDPDDGAVRGSRDLGPPNLVFRLRRYIRLLHSQNPKLGRAAQDLLMAICVNCRQHSRHDVEVMSALTKMRIKSKPLVSHFTTGKALTVNEG